MKVIFTILTEIIDEVPIILHELNDSAIHFISRDQYDRALQLLQKAQTLIDVSLSRVTVLRGCNFKEILTTDSLYYLQCITWPYVFKNLGHLKSVPYV